MPRYFFHVKDGANLSDLEGTVLPDNDAAKLEAVTSAGGMIADFGAKFWSSGDWNMTVVDEVGRTVCVLSLNGRSNVP